MKMILTLPGQSKLWSVTADLNSDQILAMRADGFDICEHVQTVPTSGRDVAWGRAQSTISKES